MNKIILRKPYGENRIFCEVAQEIAKSDYIKSLRWGCDEYVSDDEAETTFSNQVEKTKCFKTEKFSYLIVDLDEAEAYAEEKITTESDKAVIFDDELSFY